jgi:peptide/nickel transport system permease protein
MTVGFVAVGIYLAIGVVLGALAGYFGGKVDILISRVIEVVMLFPALFLILTLVALLGRSIYIIMIVIGITGWPSIARLVRGDVLKQRTIEYTLAARALGSPSLRIVFRHILPNALSSVLVAAPFGIASAIITEANLSMLGYGVEPPTPSWGTLLHQGNTNYHYWWLIVVPSIGIFLTVTLFNLVGSGLRNAMDPKLRM